MANIKITDLVALTDPASTDVLPIVDVGADATKKVSIADLLENAGSGTAAAPGIAFDGDSDTGIYSPGADQVAISTNGAGRLFIDSSGNLGLGTSSPNGNLHISAPSSSVYDSANMLSTTSFVRASNTDTTAGIAAGITFEATGDDAFAAQAAIRCVHTGNGAGALALGTKRGGGNPVTETLRIDSSGNVGIGTTGPDEKLDVSGTDDVKAVIQTTSTGDGANASLRLKTGEYNWLIQTGGTLSGGLRFFDSTNSAERARIDSSGRLLVGTSSSLGSKQAIYQDQSEDALTIRVNAASYPYAFLNFDRQIAGSAVTSGASLGSVAFRGWDGSDVIPGASITCSVDGTPGANDMPGRLVFSTTPDGSSSPTEQLRITSDRYIRLASGTGGIQFNGDTAAANALDDYEEGTWTPALAFGGGSTAITYSSRAGYYTKIGKQVFLTLYFNLSSKGTDTGSATVTGLPFTSEDFNISGALHWPGSIPSRRQNQTSTNFAMMVLENTATIACANGAGIAVTDTNFTNGTIIECFLSYRAA